MKKKLERLLALTLAFLMAFSVLPMTAGAEETETWTQMKDLAALKAGGEFAIVAKTDSGYYELGTAISGKINGTSVTVTDGVLSGDVQAWTAAPSEDGVSLYNGSKYLTYSGSTNLGSGDTAYTWAVEDASETGTFIFKASTDSKRGIGFQTSESGGRFGGYAVSNDGNGYVFGLMVFSKGGTTPTPGPGTDPEPAEAYKPAAGDEVVIFYNSSDTAGKIMTGTPAGNNNDRLAGADATISEGKLTTKGEPLYLTVGVDENGQYTFSNDGKNLTTGATGGSLTMEATPEGNLDKWTLEAHEDHWHIYSAEAAYNGNKNQAIEYYNAFYPFGYQEKYESSYVMTFYKKDDVTVEKDEPEPEPPVTGTTWTKVELADIKDTDTVTITMTKEDVVYVLPNVGEGSKGQPLAVVAKASGDTLTTDGAEKYSWNMVKTDDGYFIKTGDKYLYTINDNNGMRIGDTQGVWTLDVTYLKSSDGTNDRWLGIQATADWRAYKSTTSIANQTVGFWKLGEGGDTPTPPTPGGEIADGTYVIWNVENKKALSSVYDGNYNSGVDVAEDGGKLSGYTDAEIWTVKKESDGTYSISTADGKKLSMDTQYTSMPLDKANDKWQIQAQDDGTYYIFNTGREAYVEWFAQKNYWSCYYNIAEGSEGLFKQQLTPAKPSGSTTEPEPDEPADSGYLPLDGDRVVIYYPGGGQVMTGTADGTRLKGAAASVSGGKLFTDGTHLVLNVTVTGEGDSAVYTFTNDDGKVLSTKSTGQSLTLEEKGSADQAQTWKLAKVDGGYTVTSVEAAYNGNHNQAIEYYQSNFTTYGYTEGNTIFTMQFYTEAMLGRELPTDEDIEDAIAQWGGGGDYSAYTDHNIPGDLFKPNDMLDPNAIFVAVVSGEAINPVPSGNSPYMGGVGLGSGTDDYMQFKFPTKGYGDMTMAFRLRFTKSSPEGFQIKYSTDGTHFSDFETGTYTYSYTDYTGEAPTPVTNSGTATDGYAKCYRDSQYIEYTFDVPAGAENADMLYIRMVPAAKAVNGKAPGSSNNVRIDSVTIKGSPITDETLPGYVTAEPDGQEEDIPAGTEITLTASNEGADVYYRFVKTDGTDLDTVEWTKGTTATLPTQLPVALEMKAVKGEAEGPVRRLVYQAGTVESVKMKPNGGGIVFTGETTTATIELSCATAGATIMYRTTAMKDDKDGDGEIDYVKYETPITVEKGFGTLTVDAYAVKEGLADSAVVSRTFTEREKEKYDLYFGQMHSHTGVSDGTETPAAAYAHADDLDDAWNMDFLSVTDHSNSIDGAGGTKTINDEPDQGEWQESKAAAAAATNDKFVGIYGYEMTWSNGLGHINTFNTAGFQDRTQSAYTTYSTALQNYYAELKTAPASISQFNHPGTTFGDFSDFAHYDPEIDELITLIEVGNGEGAIGSSGYFPSYEYYTRALDKGWHVAPTNNQDNHKGHWGDANTGRDVVLVDELTEDAIYDAMRNYRVYATEDLNLEIYYTFDGQLMGTQLTKDDVGDTAAIKVELNDPDAGDHGTAKVEVIVNGGVVAASTTSTLNGETVTIEVPTSYNYYYIKVTEADGDIAVTAPVWVGAVEAVGVSSFAAQGALTVVGEEQTFDLSLYNNEKKSLEVDSIVVTDKATGETVATVQGITQVKKMGTAETSFKYTFDTDGIYTLTAAVKGTLDGVEKTYTQDLEVTVMPAELVTNIIVDGTHYNDYVTGYYGGNMGNMTTIAANNAVQVTVVGPGKQIIPEMLENCSLLVLSAPAKKSGTANAGNYVPSLWEDEFIDMVRQYVQNGGSVVVTGLADYQDKGAEDVYHTSAQQNKLLEAIGSGMRINDDEICDDTHNGGQNYRLYPETFNTESKWVKGIVEGQVYSQYSGCSIDVGETGTWLVKGWDDSTYSIDSDKDNLGGINIGTPVYFMGYEKVGQGNVFVSGGVFLSDFEVKAELDNIWDLPYANRTIYENILGELCLTENVTPIADTRKADLNKLFVIEGYVTNGTEYEPTTFFDAIYVQDETGGTTCFPYASAGLKIGTKVRILGYTDAYQDDREIQIISLSVLDSEPNVYPARVLTTKEAMDYATYGGQYVETTGTVSDLIMEGGKVAQFKLTDYTGVKATIFIDGYIWNREGKDNVSADIKEGMVVTAAGMSYMHPEGEGDSVCVLRVRDMDDIKLNTTLPENPNPDNPGPVDPGPSNPGTPSEPSTPSQPEPFRFEDVAEGSWYEDAVYKLYELGIIEGVGGNKYAPNVDVDRASIAMIIYRLAGKPAVTGGKDFADVTSGDWYFDAVKWVSDVGYMIGLGDGTFGAKDDITRQDMIVTLYHYAKQNGYDVSVDGYTMPGFVDIDSVADYAKEAMIWAVKAGISNGVGGNRLAPTETASRAEVATLVYRMIALAEGK